MNKVLHFIVILLALSACKDDESGEKVENDTVLKETIDTITNELPGPPGRYDSKNDFTWLINNEELKSGMFCSDISIELGINGINKKFDLFTAGNSSSEFREEDYQFPGLPEKIVSGINVKGTHEIFVLKEESIVSYVLYMGYKDSLTYRDLEKIGEFTYSDNEIQGNYKKPEMHYYLEFGDRFSGNYSENH